MYLLQLQILQYKFQMIDKSVAIYARTAMEIAGTTQSADAQVAMLRQYCGDRRWTVVEIYCDAATGSDSERPAFHRLMEAARRKPKPFDSVVVRSLDRLSRDQVDAVLMEAELHELGIELAFLSKGMSEELHLNDFIRLSAKLVKAKTDAP